MDSAPKARRLLPYYYDDDDIFDLADLDDGTDGFDIQDHDLDDLIMPAPAPSTHKRRTTQFALVKLRPFQDDDDDADPTWMQHVGVPLQQRNGVRYRLFSPADVTGNMDVRYALMETHYSMRATRYTSSTASMTHEDENAVLGNLIEVGTHVIYAYAHVVGINRILGIAMCAVRYNSADTTMVPVFYAPYAYLQQALLFYIEQCRPGGPKKTTVFVKFTDARLIPTRPTFTKLAGARDHHWYGYRRTPKSEFPAVTTTLELQRQDFARPGAVNVYRLLAAPCIGCNVRLARVQCGHCNDAVYYCGQRCADGDWHRHGGGGE